MGERPRSPGFIQSISKAQLKVVGLLDAAGAPVGGVDTTALHKATAAEISALTAKATPTTSDFLVIEDAAAANAKKRITIGDLPAVGMTSVVRAVSTTDATQTAVGAILVPTADSTMLVNLRMICTRGANGDWASFQLLGLTCNNNHTAGTITVANYPTAAAPDNSLGTGSTLRLALDGSGGVLARITANALEDWSHSLVIEYLELAYS